MINIQHGENKKIRIRIFLFLAQVGENEEQKPLDMYGRHRTQLGCNPVQKTPETSVKTR